MYLTISICFPVVLAVGRVTDLAEISGLSSMATDEESPLIHPISPPLNHLKDVHVLSWAFLLVFLAYGAVQNLQSTINTVKLLLLCSNFLNSLLGFKYCGF